MAERRFLVLHPAASGSELLGLRRIVGARLRRSPASVIDCIVLDGAVDLRIVAAVARLQLAARSAGGCIRLIDVPPELAALLSLAGLPACTGLRVQMIRHPEQREEAGGVQEEGDAADPIA
ncbi:MAG TPA: hypothetical protein VFK61_05170 [Candidatus Limnocylindria bacterium]|nr:hypothetical protein [Candidatus Limnocylindria bacterium]